MALLEAYLEYNAAATAGIFATIITAANISRYGDRGGIGAARWIYSESAKASPSGTRNHGLVKYCAYWWKPLFSFLKRHLKVFNLVTQQTNRNRTLNQRSSRST